MTQATAVLPVLCLQVAPRPHLLAPTAAARSSRSSLEHFSAVPWRWSVTRARRLDPTATSQAFPPAAISLRCLKANRPCAPVRKTTQLSLSRRAAGKTRLRPRCRPFVPRGRAGDGRGQSRARWVPTRRRDAAGSIASPPPRPKPRAPPGSHPELGPALEATIWPRSPLPVPSPTSLDNSDNEDRLRSCCRTAEPSCCVAAPHPLGADPTPTLPGRRFGAFGRERGWAAGPLSSGRPPPLPRSGLDSALPHLPASSCAVLELSGQTRPVPRTESLWYRGIWVENSGETL